MVSCLLNHDTLLLNGHTDKKIRINAEMFLNAVQLIADDIKRNYSLLDENIGLLGIARGALPLLTAVAHNLDVRKIAIMHIQMTNSDNVKDYGEVRFLGEMLDPNIKQYILLEDIISHGRSAGYVVRRLQNKAVKIRAVYSIVLNDFFKTIEFDNDKLDIKYVYRINDLQWVHFFWEQGYYKD